jgi:hypothetical protein
MSTQYAPTTEESENEQAFELVIPEALLLPLARELLSRLHSHDGISTSDGVEVIRSKGVFLFDGSVLLLDFTSDDVTVYEVE